MPLCSAISLSTFSAVWVEAGRSSMAMVTASKRFFAAGAAISSAPGGYSCNSWIDQKMPCCEPVCSMRRNFVFVGFNSISVTPGVPLPSLIGLPHVLPSFETVTL